jgi:hypothetical protein
MLAAQSGSAYYQVKGWYLGVACIGLVDYDKWKTAHPAKGASYVHSLAQSDLIKPVTIDIPIDMSAENVLALILEDVKGKLLADKHQRSDNSAAKALLREYVLVNFETLEKLLGFTQKNTYKYSEMLHNLQSYAGEMKKSTSQASSSPDAGNAAIHPNLQFSPVLNPALRNDKLSDEHSQKQEHQGPTPK